MLGRLVARRPCPDPPDSSRRAGGWVGLTVAPLDEHEPFPTQEGNIGRCTVPSILQTLGTALERPRPGPTIGGRPCARQFFHG